jgi:muramidase (phage lysozyme)
MGSDLSAALNPALDFLDFATGGILKLSNMRTVTAADLGNKNVQAMLKVIRTGEGTADANGYRRIFGGQLFNSFADHPRVSVTKNGYTSTAAGAYQALISTWDETRSIMRLKDFSPASQDLFAVGRIAARGALDDIKAGRFTLAIQKISPEWASMPFSTHGQPVISMEKATQIYATNGGAIYA